MPISSPSGNLQPAEAEVDGHLPRLFFFQTIRVCAGEGLDQRGLAVVNMPRRAYDAHFALESSCLPAHRCIDADAHHHPLARGVFALVFAWPMIRSYADTHCCARFMRSCNSCSVVSVVC